MEMPGEQVQQQYATDPVQQQALQYQPAEQVQQYVPDPAQQALQYQRSMMVPQQATPQQWSTTATPIVAAPHPLGERRFKCPDPDCPMATMGYTSSVGLYQHKRSKHPWLIKQRPRRERYCIDNQTVYLRPAPTPAPTPVHNSLSMPPPPTLVF